MYNIEKIVNKAGGIEYIKSLIEEEGFNYEVCKAPSNLNVHHIISYWLFDDNDVRVHNTDNLLTVCDSCHGKLHQQNTSIVPHISEMKYKNLLELLESLKNQVPDSLLETLRSVEKQLGLTDNQQPSI